MPEIPEHPPVLDFLFEYYAFAPGQLRRWLPGIHQRVSGKGSEALLDAGPYHQLPDGSIGLDAAAFPAARLASLAWVIELLTSTAGRPPAFTCYGLHEWAMLYQSDRPRHRLPLRLGQVGTDAVVENHCIRCTHYDAFRFFTEAARPLNQVQPGADDRHLHEQPGCLHANMDLYRWASKFHPWLGSDIVGDCFVLACRIRELDMAASPYDVSAHGLEPVAVETPEGKRHYAHRQKALAEAAAPLRARLIELCRCLQEAVSSS